MPRKYELMRKETLTPGTTRIAVYAPACAKKAKAGQFVILRVDEEGERIPLTVSSCGEDGSVTVIFQAIGATTMCLEELEVGQCLSDFVGPLGKPTEVEGYEGKRVIVVGGGLGSAIALPVAKALKDAGAKVETVVGFRTKDIVILEDEMRAASDELYVCTDDGSYGFAGFTTVKLEELLKDGPECAMMFAIGPLAMMKFCCRVAAKYGVPATVSMNPIMIDGTGMCGCCRVTVGGKVMFACVDGPDFDGHQVDFDEAISRLTTYKDFEQKAKEAHICNLTGGVRNG